MSLTKKVFVAVMLFLCSVNVVLAHGIDKTNNLIEILAEAKKNDTDAVLAKMKIDVLAKASLKVKEEAEKINVLAGTAETQLKSKVAKYIEPLRADMSLAIAIDNERQRLAERDIAITYCYYQVYLTNLAKDIAEIELDIAKNNYNAAKIRLKKGSVSGYALANERYVYEQKKLSMIDCSNKHKKALFNLNELLEIDLSTAITVDDNVDLEVSKDWDIDVDSFYDTALKVSEEIKVADKEAEFAAMKLQYAKEEYKTNSDEYLDIAVEKEKSDHELLRLKNMLYMDISYDSNFISVGLNRYELLKIKLEMEQSNMITAEIKLKRGHISENDYLQFKVNMLNCKYQLYSLITELNYRYQSFRVKYLSQNS